MKSKLTLLVSLFFLGINGLGAQENVLRLSFSNLPLTTAIQQLEASSEYLFTFQQASIQEVRVSYRGQANSMEELLDELLLNTGLRYQIVQDKFVLLSENIEAPSQLCGTVLDSLTQRPLAFASVYWEGTDLGTYTSADGRFELPYPIEKKELIISFVGFEEKSIPIGKWPSGDCPEVLLSYYSFAEGLVVVTDYLAEGIQLGDQGASTILFPDRNATLPGQVEPDIWNSIQFLPGISSPDGEVSRLHIRGGSPDQNLVLWESIPVYHPGHFFGTISAINTYTLERATVFRGGFPANYGDRISGVIDLESFRHPVEETSLGAGANTLLGYTYGKTSFETDRLSMTFSLRRSFTEWWKSPAYQNLLERNIQGFLLGNQELSQLPDHIELEDGFNLADMHLKTGIQLSQKDVLNLAGFHAADHFSDQITDAIRNQNQVDTLTNRNRGWSLRWQRKWSPRISTEVAAVSTRLRSHYFFEFDPGLNTLPGRTGIRSNDLQEYHWLFSGAMRTNSGMEWEAGYEGIYRDVSYEVRHRAGELTLAEEGSKDQSASQAVYLSFRSPSEQFAGLELGLRSTYFQRNESLFLEPRLHVWWEISPGIRLHGNAGQYRQFVNQLLEFRGNNVSIDSPVWILAGTKATPVLKAGQVQLGLVFDRRSWLVDLQTYYKHIRGLTSLTVGFDLSPEPFDLGNSSVKGLDLLLKKRWSNYQSWISYSLSQVEYKFPTFFDTEFPAPHDQRHVIQWAHLWKLGSFECSLGWKLATGKPYAVFDNFKVIQVPQRPDQFIPMYEQYNSKRLPLQHQLDLSLNYRFSKNEWQGMIGFSLTNLYNRKNLYSREYYVDATMMEPPHIEILDKFNPGITPNLVIRLVR